MAKRARTSNSFVYAPPRTFAGKRPIDKALIAISKSVTDTQSETVLATATFPCTVTGLRWSIGSSNGYVTGANPLYWAIVLVKDGESAQNIAVSDASSFYQPEQNVLVWGCSHHGQKTDGYPVLVNDQGSSKTMRKLMGGDKLVLVLLSGAATISVRGCVQFFCKT